MTAKTAFRRLPLLLALLPFVGACGAGQSAPNPFDQRGPGRVTVEVFNDGWEQVTLHLETRSGRRYLGRVQGESRATFTFTLDVSQEVAIEVDVLAGGRCLTREIPTDPGDVLELQIRETDCSG